MHKTCSFKNSICSNLLNYLNKIFMKSRLRSRWYRSSEKPLETSSESQKSKEPFGEITPSSKKLQDDLSNAKPPPNRERGSQGHRKGRSDHQSSNENRDGRNRSQRPRNPNRDSRRHEGDSQNKEKRRPNHEDRPKRGNQERDPSAPQNRKPRRRKNKNHSDSKRNDTRNEPKLIKKEEKVPKKSGLGGFISKLFGG